MIIGTVPYSNSLPLTKHLPGTIIALPPTELTKALLEGKIDVGLLPVYAIIKHGLKMHPDIGIIGCDGPVKSVGFYTRSYIEELQQIRSLYLDKESLSSAYLAKIILKKFYKLSLYDLEFFHHDKREMADAQLLIGDKALFFDKKLPYRFWDIGEIWHQHTQTGFMFACWASKHHLTPAEIDLLKQAKEKGLQDRTHLALSYKPHKQKIIEEYLTHNICYNTTPTIKEGLKYYREFLAEYDYDKPLETKVA